MSTKQPALTKCLNCIGRGWDGWGNCARCEGSGYEPGQSTGTIKVPLSLFNGGVLAQSAETVSAAYHIDVVAKRDVQIAELRALAQKTADQECVYLREITMLRAERDAWHKMFDDLTARFTAANVAPDEAKPAHNPFREFPAERRRVGGPI